MAATDQTYRNQRTLDIVFAVSCVLMLLGTLWMLVQDYNREFKTVQRQFRDVETALNERILFEMLPQDALLLVDARIKAIDEARAALDKAKQQVATDAAQLQADKDKLTAQAQKIKAELDSKASYRDIAIEEKNAADTASERRRLNALVEKLSGELDGRPDVKGLIEQYREALDALDRNSTEYQEKVGQYLEGPQTAYIDAQDEMKKLTGTFDRFAKITSEKVWKPGDSFRNWPIIDAFQSPTRIKQITLPDLTIDYAFKEVPRYDRCTTCHLAIDRSRYDKHTLEMLTSVPSDAKDKLKALHTLYKRRQANGEKLPFDLSDLPNDVRTVKLTSGQITQFAAHPRLDLFVDGNSAHPSEKFGCTICHAGQGSATEFNLASHAPTTALQKEHWKNEYSWEANHYWDFPMLPSRFVESSCIKCHHEVTDLIRHGSREEAPKLLRGYNLIKENGCFACHEISGQKGGRPVGPDLRLEPSPALAWLSPADQEKIKSDPANSPGNIRKVGPSLRRLAEKTNEKWTRQWIFNPRGFREDTKMPHFYNLSNNDLETLKNTSPSQADYPAAEIHAIAHYLFTESRAHLQGKDAYRVALEKGLADLQDQLNPQGKKNPLEDRVKKDLDDVTKNLGDLALLSAPFRSAEINQARADVKQYQDALQELYRQRQDYLSKKKVNDLKIQRMQRDLENPRTKEDRKAKLEEDIASLQSENEGTEKEIADFDKNLAAPWDALQKATKELLKESRPRPLSAGLVDYTEQPVKLDGKAGNATTGRKLFTERGCMACHSHDGTERGGNPVHGDSNFGPNLSRIAAKIAPDVGGDAGRRLWLVQWLLNPNVHHPRTRMPVTFLSVAEASDVAEWLLTTGPRSYNGEDPEAPKEETLRAMARLYLSRLQGVSRMEVDSWVPEPGKGPIKGIPSSRLKNFGRDADERRLEEGFPESQGQERLTWYVGKKGISRLGCFACHDLPGFENAKPIGTPLNDWGKKDPARLAFEDVVAFLKDRYNVVPERLTKEDLENLDRDARLSALMARVREQDDKPLTTAEKDELTELMRKGPMTERERRDLQDLKKRIGDNTWRIKDGKLPYEQFFADLLEHHQREGFLHQKLMEPRSFDYSRRRDWDDRLRMPQFQFARSRQKPGETPEEYELRHTREEAEAREAVMTFVLGLVADNVPLKYVNTPPPDRLAEVKGRQVLDRFNCAGCHQIRPGVYELKQSGGLMTMLDEVYKEAKPNSVKDYPIPGHNAWFGTPPLPDRLIAHATQRNLHAEEKDSYVSMRLTDALRFNSNGLTRDLPAAAPRLRVSPRDLMSSADPFGGVLSELLVGYLKKDNPVVIKSDDDARNRLPPPLVREGERVQPNWLYQFLLNPTRIRPQEVVILRMPKFNMSPDESQAIVNYFAAVERLNNPGAGLANSFLAVPQQDEKFWQRKTEEYLKNLGEKRVKEKLDNLRDTVWPLVLEDEVSAAKRKVAVAEDAIKQAGTDNDKKKAAEKVRDGLKDELKAAETRLSKKDFSDLEKQWRTRDAYPADAFRLLVGHANSVCLSCHKIGNLIQAPQGPPLEKVYDRLRPEWTVRWLGNPQRLFAYDTVMPQNFPANDPGSPNLFDGTSREQIMAIRDVLMDLPRIADLPVNRYYRVQPAGGGK
jgi:mono/diheme cytochrome c family protein